jgi:YfiH family protein
MHFVQKNGLRFLQFSNLANVTGLFHGVYTRFYLDMTGRKHSLNLGLDCGDTRDTVLMNRHKMLMTAGTDVGVFIQQVHGTDVQVLGGNPGVRDANLAGDALITAVEARALVIQVADCQSVLLADPRKRVVANIHSGWRGSIKNIIGRTVDVMVQQFESRPQDIFCGIGPSLGPCCAEFIHFRREIPSKYWGYRRSRDLFDFWQLSIDQLTAAGIPERQIETSCICTKCNQHLFFSYRGRNKTGRFAAVICLHE